MYTYVTILEGLERQQLSDRYVLQLISGECEGLVTSEIKHVSAYIESHTKFRPVCTLLMAPILRVKPAADVLLGMCVTTNSQVRVSKYRTSL